MNPDCEVDGGCAARLTSTGQIRTGQTRCGVYPDCEVDGGLAVRTRGGGGVGLTSTGQIRTRGGGGVGRVREPRWDARHLQQRDRLHLPSS